MNCELPDDVIDVSQFRQVPDNQEVFIIEKGDSTKQDKSIIIEILEVPESDIENSLKTHLSDLLEIEISDIEGALQAESRTGLEFEQVSNEISEKNYLALFKYNPKSILVVYGLVRVDKVECDFLVSMFISLDNQDYTDVKDKPLSYIIENQGSLNIQSDIKAVECAVKTMVIKNWSLFG